MLTTEKSLVPDLNQAVASSDVTVRPAKRIKHHFANQTVIQA